MIICPYINPAEISNLYSKCLAYPHMFEKDDKLIGPDLMYEKMWNQTTEDIIILHSDMDIIDPDWYVKLEEYVKKYPKTGMFGLKLLYPARDDKGNFYIQSAGGKFVDGIPKHFGSGVDLETRVVWGQPETDIGQYDFVRKVAWTTFGGVYIRRELLDQVGNFDRDYSWSYNRDVDYCLKARRLGWDIYQVPIPLLHFESRDVKKIRNAIRNAQEARNLEILRSKWGSSEYYQTIDEKINE